MDILEKIDLVLEQEVTLKGKFQGNQVTPKKGDQIRALAKKGKVKLKMDISSTLLTYSITGDKQDVEAVYTQIDRLRG